MKFNFFKNKKKYKKEKFKLSPAVYWRIILVVFFVFLGNLAFLGFSVYSDVSSEDFGFFINENIRGKIIKEKENEVQEIVSFFEERENQRIKYLENPIIIIDPSL